MNEYECIDDLWKEAREACTKKAIALYILENLKDKYLLKKFQRNPGKYWNIAMETCGFQILKEGQTNEN